VVAQAYCGHGRRTWKSDAMVKEAPAKKSSLIFECLNPVVGVVQQSGARDVVPCPALLLLRR